MIQKTLMQIFGLNVKNVAIDYFRLQKRMEYENLKLIDLGYINIRNFIPLPLRTYGVEIEGIVRSRERLKRELERNGMRAQLTGYNGGRINDYIAIGRDSSIEIRGGEGEPVEITTPKLLGWGKKGFEVVRKIVEKWQEVGGEVNETCGCHVHVGTWHWRGTRYKKLVLYMYIFQDFYWSIVPQRRNNRYCLPWLAEEIYNLVKYNVLPERYRMINLSNMDWEHGHVEFRLFPATLDIEQIEAFTLLSLETVELLNRWNKVIEFIKNALEENLKRLLGKKKKNKKKEEGYV